MNFTLSNDSEEVDLEWFKKYFREYMLVLNDTEYNTKEEEVESILPFLRYDDGNGIQMNWDNHREMFDILIKYAVVEETLNPLDTKLNKGSKILSKYYEIQEIRNTYVDFIFTRIYTQKNMVTIPGTYPYQFYSMIPLFEILKPIRATYIVIKAEQGNHPDDTYHSRTLQEFEDKNITYFGSRYLYLLKLLVDFLIEFNYLEDDFNIKRFVNKTQNISKYTVHQQIWLFIRY
jgi:hypothetical protein